MNKLEDYLSMNSTQLELEAGQVFLRISMIQTDCLMKHVMMRFIIIVLDQDMVLEFRSCNMKMTKKVLVINYLMDPQ